MNAPTIGAVRTPTAGQVANRGLIEIEPAPSFVVGAGASQPLFAVVHDQGRVLKDAVVTWRVEPASAGEIRRDNEGASFVAGRAPMSAEICAEYEGVTSEKTEVHIWPANGVRMGFRAIGGEYPTVMPPGPRPVGRPK